MPQPDPLVQHRGHPTLAPMQPTQMPTLESPTASLHRYPPRSLRADGLRSGAGLALTLGPFALAAPHPLIAVPLLGAAALFALFGVRTALRRATRYRLDGDGLAAEGPWPRRIAWAALDGLRLAYFSTRRDRRDGWMQLTVTAGGVRLSLESPLHGFEEIALAAARAAEARGLPLAGATLDNLTALGFRPRRG